MQPYAVYVHEKVLNFLLTASRDRERILAFVRHLANDPYTHSDFEDSYEIGRPLEVKLVGSYAVTYWADHAVKEVKVVNVEPAGS